jgi:hypothetical protein
MLAFVSIASDALRYVTIDTKPTDISAEYC